jgi:hypothetical protein
MVAFLTETWEQGTPGNAVNRGNSAWNGFVSSGWTFVADSPGPAQGSVSGRMVCSNSNGQVQAIGISPKPAGYWPIFLKAESYPSVDTTMASYRGSGNSATLAELRITPAGALQLRNSGFVRIVASPSGIVPVNSWCRIEWLYNNATAQQRVRIFTDPFGASPVWDSGLVNTTAAGPIDTVNLGAVNASTWAARFGDVIVDGSAFPVYGGGGGNVDPPLHKIGHATDSGQTVQVDMPPGAAAGMLAVLAFWGSGGGWTQTATGWPHAASQAAPGITFDLWEKALTAADVSAGHVTVSSNNTVGAYKRDLHLIVFPAASAGAVASAVATVASTAHTTPTSTATDPGATALVGCGDRASPGSQAWDLGTQPLAVLEQSFGSGGAAVSSITAIDDAVGSGSVGSYVFTGTVGTNAVALFTAIIEPPGTPPPTGSVNAGPDLTVLPWKPVQITAGITGTPTAIRWEQVSPSAPLLTLAGSTTAAVSFDTPGSTDLIVYKLRVTATIGGVDFSDSVNVSVLPASEWLLNAAGVMVPTRSELAT